MNYAKPIEEVAKEAAFSALSGGLGGLSGLYFDEAIKLANEMGSAAQILMEYDEQFGMALKIFFNTVTDILSASPSVEE